MSFRVSQHAKDEQLLGSFVNFFGCGRFNYHNKEMKAVVFVVRKFKDINTKIIPFFKGVKHKDFLDWSEVAKLIESRDHLVLEGYNKILSLRL